MAGLVEADSRRRVSLGKYGNPDHSLYLASDSPDGSILLTPAAVMAEHEAALLRADPALAARIEAEMADPSQAAPSEARRPANR